MKSPLILAALIAVPVSAQVPAGPSTIQIEVAPGSTLTDNVRPSNTTRNVTVTRNPQDTVTATFPVHMHGGLNVDTTTLRAPDPGFDVDRVKDTTEEPQPSTQQGGAFRTFCATYAWIANNDWLVYPGQPDKSHSHLGFNNTFGGDAFMTSDLLMTSGNSACRGGTINRSAYWVPNVINTTDSKVILPNDFDIYYKGGDAIELMNDLPNGLRMIAGNPSATLPQSNPLTYRYKCGAVFYQSIPQDDTKCPAGSKIGFEVFFPVCWDGVNLDSPDHKSHMAYRKNIKVPGSVPAVYENRCPATHPKQIPHLSFSYSYTVPATGIRTMRLVTDTDITATKLPGIGLHGDYSAAWKDKYMKMWVQNCLRDGKECHSHLLGRDPDDGKFKAIH
jgi:hypothetical protein